MPWHLLRVDWTFSNNSGANTALSAINSTLTANGRAEQAVKSGTRVSVTLDGLSPTEAVSLRDALTPKWATGTRTAGMASVEMRDESSQ